MKILFDHQIFTMQREGGISRYFFELMQNLYSRKQINFILALKYSNNNYIKRSIFSRPKPFFPDVEFKGKYILMDNLNKINSLYRLVHEKYDIFHPTYYNPYFLKYIGNKPFILTIYDMIHEITPEYFPKTDKVRKYKKYLAENAAKIIAISENTKRDIIRFLDIDPEKIEVIYLGNSFTGDFFENMPDNLNKPIFDNYLLFVGNRNNYKNFNFFITSIKSLFNEFNDMKVICAGGGSFSTEEKMFFRDLSIENKIIQLNVNDCELANLYLHAHAFIFPSLYEGFGIPVLEAFSCGCPAIISNSSSLSEVGGDAAHYFDPKDADSIISAVSDVLYDEDMRYNMIIKGHRRADTFSWEKTAIQTKGVYEKLIEN